jgi:hypothetical protein
MLSKAKIKTFEETRALKKNIEELINQYYANVSNNEEASIIYDYSDLLTRHWNAFTKSIVAVTNEADLNKINQSMLDFLNNFKIKQKQEIEMKELID